MGSGVSIVRGQTALSRIVGQNLKAGPQPGSRTCFERVRFRIKVKLGNEEDLNMLDRRPVSIEEHHKIEQFLYREAEILDAGLLREWLDTCVNPEIRYQVVMQQERFRKDKSPVEELEITPFDEDYAMLDLRVRQFETGLQTMLDPAPKMRRVITNIRAFHYDQEGSYRVLSYGIASRFRRLYEHEQIVYAREDVVRTEDDGELRLGSRRIDLDERVVRSKNLLFFL